MAPTPPTNAIDNNYSRTYARARRVASAFSSWKSVGEHV